MKVIAVPEPSARWEVFASAEARYVGRFDHLLYGGRAGAAIALTENIQLAFDAGAELGAKTVALGDVNIGLASARAGADYALELSDTFRVAIGPRVEVGYAWASGSAFDSATIERSARGPVLVGSLQAIAAVSISDTLSLFLAPELGGAFYGFDTRVNDARALGVSGLLFKAALGASWDLAARRATR